MKKLLWCCLVLAPLHLLAQNIDLQDINLVLHTRDLDSVNQHLQKNGFMSTDHASQLRKKRSVTAANSWLFRVSGNLDLEPPSLLYKVIDSAGATVALETFNPWFYAHLMNQLPDLGFEYRQTIVTDNKAVLHFSNGRDVLTISITSGLQPKNFQFAIREGSDVTVATRAIPAVRAVSAAKRVRANPVRTSVIQTEKIK